MATEVWFRNPLTYIRECAELLQPNVVWDRGFAHKNSIDPQKQLELNYPSGVNYRILMIGDQGTAELRYGFPLDKPAAVYPTWEYGQQNLDILEELLDHPVGNDPAMCQPNGRLPDTVPVLGQEHRVVVTHLPDSRRPEGRAILVALAELQADYPEAIIHLHGVYSYRIAFGSGVRAADVDPRPDAAAGRIILGSGKVVPRIDIAKYGQWIHLHGYSLDDMTVARNRCMFNIKSAVWAGANYENPHAFKSQGSASVDPYAVSHVPATTTSHSPGAGVQGDKITCDTCSLQPTCKYARAGAVCALPDTEGAKLAAFFGSRDDNRVLQGMNRIMQINADRLEMGHEGEKIEGVLDATVSKVAADLFKMAEHFAKMINPALAKGSTPSVNVNILNAQGGGTSQGLMAAIVADLEAQGIDRADITPEMVSTYLAAISNQQKAIEATSRD